MPSTPNERRRYMTPCLVPYGAVHEVTTAGSRVGMENTGAMAMINNMG